MQGGDTITISFTVTNTGDRQGADVPQVYLTGAPDGARMRLLGFERIDLKPGESTRVTVTADPRLIARFDSQARQWRITEGTYQVALGRAADSLDLAAETVVHGALFGS